MILTSALWTYSFRCKSAPNLRGYAPIFCMWINFGHNGAPEKLAAKKVGSFPPGEERVENTIQRCLKHSCKGSQAAPSLMAATPSPAKQWRVDETKHSLLRILPPFLLFHTLLSTD